MKNPLRALFVALVFALPLATAPFAPASQPQNEKKQRSEEKYRAKLVKEVRHQLVLLPYYSVFDNLEFKVEGDKVTLSGQVVRPTLKSDAEAAVKVMPPSFATASRPCPRFTSS
jgi:hypothetical protein